MQLRSNSDTNIIKALCKRKTWDALVDTVPKEMLSADTQALLGWLKLYWSTYPDDTVVHWGSMSTLLTLRGSQLPKEQLVLLKALMKKVQEVPDSTSVSVAQELTELAYSGEAGALIKRYQEGAEIDILEELQGLTKKYKQVAGTQASLIEWEDTSLSELLNDTDDDSGLKLCIFKEFKDKIRALRGGDLILVAAAPDAGKTSLIANIVTSLVHQMQQQDKYKHRCVYWLVNESMASRSRTRFYQAVAGHKTMQELKSMHSTGDLEKTIKSVLGGLSTVRLKDAHSMTMGQISTLLEETKPAILVIDMVANIRGGQYETEHQNLEARWQQLRVLGCEHDCIIIGTSQLSKDGFNTLYPALHHLKESKVGVQGAVDLAIFMGRLDEAEFHTLRGISTPKNKLARSGMSSDIRFEVEFNGATCHFDDGAGL